MEILPEAATASPAWREKFSRQLILPQVGVEGQKKWSESSFLLAGEGKALEAAGLALGTSGVSNLYVLAPTSFDVSPWTSRIPELKVKKIPTEGGSIPGNIPAIVLTGDEGFRKKMNRESLKNGRKTLFGWTLGSGFALYFLNSSKPGNGCPCLECFEALNPKAFNEGRPEVLKILGALAASEALQWLLTEKSPLVGKVWVTSLESGLSFHHEVSASPKCPASLAAKGFEVFP